MICGCKILDFIVMEPWIDYPAQMFYLSTFLQYNRFMAPQLKVMLGNFQRNVLQLIILTTM